MRIKKTFIVFILILFGYTIPMILFLHKTVSAQESVSPETQAADMGVSFLDNNSDNIDNVNSPNIIESKGMNRKISLDLKGMEISEVLKFLARKADVNIVARKSVVGRVTLYLKNVSVEDALEIILVTNNLAQEVKGNIITVMTENDYLSLYGKQYYDKRELKTMKLEYSSPENVSAILGLIKSSIGKIIIDNTTGTVILIDTPEKVKEMEQMIKKIEKSSALAKPFPTETKIFELSYAVAEDIQGEIEAALTEHIGSVRIDERTNTLVVTDFPQKLKEIETLINAFDRKTRQVLIEAKIIQIRLNDEFNMGIEWEKVFKEKYQGLDFVGSFPVSSTLSASQRIIMGSLDRDHWTATMNFLSDYGKTEILSSPRILAIHNEEAKILVGTREAYVTQTISQGEVTTTTAESIEFVEVGVKLYVTPLINKDKIITLKIRPEVSSVTSTLTTSQGSQIPIIETSEAETTIIVKDGTTVIIAGLIKDTKTDELKKVPLLGDIPLLGMAFRQTRDYKLKTEIVVFLTPHIISGEENISALTGAEKKRKPLRQ